MKNAIIYLLVFTSACTVIAQEKIIRKDWWKTYSGELNGKEIAISLNRGSDNELVGSSCDLIQDHKVSFVSTESGSNLTLKAMINDSIIGAFNGILIQEEDDFYKGEYRSAHENASYKFNLKYSSGSYGTAEKRYIDFAGTDAQLEQFAQDIIVAFTTQNKEWLSQQMGYPLPVYLENKKKLTITSPTQFIEKYEQIATQTLLNKMNDWTSCNLFSNHSGVMLGRGEIWIWREDTATDKEPKYRVKDIVTF